MQRLSCCGDSTCSACLSERKMSSSQGVKQEYVVRASKSKKRYNMMRFHSALAVDFKTWGSAKLERENNLKEFKMDEEMPKYGAGSEYGREQREEARRKRFGIAVKKYRPEDQPWILTVGGKSGKKFKGIREGGVSDNVSWYVFMQAKDGAFDAYPVEEWYNFHPIQRYKALSAEEAEKEFEKRDKIMNYFSVMYQKKLKKDEEVEAEEGPKKKGSSAKSLMLSELDDWMSEGDSDEGDEEEQEESSDDAKGKNKKKLSKNKQQGGKKKKLEGQSDDDCIEESDDYDEGAEHDYISSDSSDTDQENEEVATKDLAGVEEGEALKKLLNSDEEDEEEEEEKEDEEEEKKEDEQEEKERKKKKKKKKDKRSDIDSDAHSSESSDEEVRQKSNDSQKGDKSESRSKKAVGSLKRKMMESPAEFNATKKACLEVSSSTSVSSAGSSDGGVTEEAIRRYLMRKPMTTTELLQKFKSKKTGLNSEQLVHAIAQILKRINPVKQMVKGKMYLSIKTT